MHHNSLLVFFLFMLPFISAQYVPAAALYVQIGAGAAAMIGNQITQLGNNYINGVTFPDITGDSSYPYRLADFDISVSTISGISYTTADYKSYQLSWNLDLEFTFDWCVDLSSIGLGYEKGYSDVTEEGSMSFSGVLDTSGEHISMSLDNVNWPNTDIDSTCCGIIAPVCGTKVKPNINSNFESSFNPRLTSTVMSAFNSSAFAAHINSVPTTYSFPFADGTIQFGPGFDWWLVSGSSTPDIFISYTSLSFNFDGQTSSPIFGPFMVPDVNSISTPTIAVYITDFLLSATMTALASKLTQTITQSMIPSDFGVKLNTNDAFFITNVPGITAYPNMNISISTLWAGSSQRTATTSSQGTLFELADILLDFNLYNSSATYAAFRLTLDLQSNISMQSTFVNSEVTIKPVLSDIVVQSALTPGNLTSVNTTAFDVLFTFLVELSTMKIKGHSFSLPTVEGYSVSNVTITPQDGLIALLIDLSGPSVTEAQSTRQSTRPVTDPNGCGCDCYSQEGEKTKKAERGEWEASEL